MSADNGIYILETLNSTGTALEWRVAEMSAIDNLSYDESAPMGSSERFNSKNPDVLIKNAREMFAHAAVFTDKEEAILHAHFVSEMTYTEYGVCTIKVPRAF
jgi:hypothetical protein